MNERGLMDSLLVGTGGSQPGLWILPSGADRATNVLDLPAGHSVYAIDVDAANGLVAVGTRAGVINVLAWPQGSSPDTQRMLSLHQGAPVLSVCLLGPSRLASADTAGRCLVWHLDGDPSNPQICDTGGHLICSLLLIPGDRLVGLSTDGRLVFWDQAPARPERFVIGPRPPEKLSLVPLQYWPRHRAVVYPGAHGRLALSTPDRPEMQVWDAHDGEFYAVLVEDDRLCTIGRTDGLAKVWDELGGIPSRQSKAPLGVIAAAGFGNRSGKALLIHDSFEAAVYTLRSDPLKSIGWLGARSYRSVAGPSTRLRQAADEGRQQAIVEDLLARIQEKIRSNEFEGIETLHEELVALGFESLSLAVRAQQAAMQQDLIGEMRFRRRLAQTLPPQDSRSWPALRRYAEVLEAAWRLAEAKEVFAVIPPEQMPEPSVLGWLEQATGIMAGDDWIAASASVPALIEAAGEFGRPFAGRWAVGDLGRYALASPHQALTAEVLAAKCEQIRQERRSPDLPPARSGRFSWLTPRAATPVEIVLFDEPFERTGPALRIAAEVQRCGTEYLVVLHGLLDAGRPESEQSWEGHNRQALAVFRQTEQAGPMRGWPRPVREIIAMSLRRLRNLTRSPRTDQEGL